MDTIVSLLPRRWKFLRGRESLTIGYPGLTPGAIIALEQIIMPDWSVLELGSGGSTVFWAKHCGVVKSFETIQEWAGRTRAFIAGYPKATVMLGTPGQIAEIVWAEPDGSFDLALVDHKDYFHVHTDRLPLALAVVPKVKVGGWLVVDNYAGYGMERFDYSSPMWEVYTFDDMRWQGRGTRLCKRLGAGAERGVGA